MQNKKERKLNTKKIFFIFDSVVLKIKYESHIRVTTVEFNSETLT